MNLDKVILQWVQNHHTHALDHFMKAVSSLTSVERVTLWAAIAGILLWMNRRRNEGLVLFLGTALGGGLSVPLKQLFHRHRPPLGLAIHTYSFPSGHAMGSALFFGLLAAALGRLDPPRRVGYEGLAFIIVALVGCSRVYLGAHWPSDVLGGYLFGGLFLSLWLWLTDSFLDRK